MYDKLLLTRYFSGKLVQRLMYQKPFTMTLLSLVNIIVYCSLECIAYQTKPGLHKNPCMIGYENEECLDILFVVLILLEE